MESPAGRIQARVLEDGNVAVDMGEPDFEPRSLPFDVDGESDSYTLAAACQEVLFGAVSMGNPHVVVPVPDISTAEVERIGSAIAAHGAFPRSTNVGFMEIVDLARIRLRVRERGVGETLACGTGACAAAAVARRWGKVDREVIVELPGGELEIQWDGPGHHLWMTGPAVRVYEGIISL